LDEEQIRELLRYKDLIDGFGVGSYISNAKTVDFGLDIIEVQQSRPNNLYDPNWMSCAKRDRLEGRKNVSRCPACEDSAKPIDTREFITSRMYKSPDYNDEPPECPKCRSKREWMLTTVFRGTERIQSFKMKKPEILHKQVVYNINKLFGFELIE